MLSVSSDVDGCLRSCSIRAIYDVLAIDLIWHPQHALVSKRQVYGSPPRGLDINRPLWVGVLGRFRSSTGLRPQSIRKLGLEIQTAARPRPRASTRSRRQPPSGGECESGADNCFRFPVTSVAALRSCPARAAHGVLAIDLICHPQHALVSKRQVYPG